MVSYPLAPLGRKSSAAPVLFICTFLPLLPGAVPVTAPVRDWHRPRGWRRPPAGGASRGQTVSAMERTERTASPAKIASQATRPMAR
jgi:hypothetical protein